MVKSIQLQGCNSFHILNLIYFRFRTGRICNFWYFYEAFLLSFQLAFNYAAVWDPVMGLTAVAPSPQ